MRIWKRLLGLALCLCLCAELLPVTARAAAALPVTISTSGDTYQYAESGTNPKQLAYGTAQAETPISKAAFETGDGGTRFTLDTGWNRNFKLIYKEIPVKVTVPAKTEYTVTFRYSFGGNYHCLSGQNTAAFSAQAMYLGEKGAASDLIFHTAAGGAVKTTRNRSEVTNIYTAKRVGNSAPVETPGTAGGERVFTASFKNTDSKAQAVTRYFGVWAASGDSSREPTSLTLNFTLVPVTAAYTVTLDPDGGNVSPASKQVTLGGQYGDLPTPTKAGFTFIGWYTAKTGGTKVGRYNALVSTGSHTLYARWSQNHTHEAVPGGGDKTFDGELNTGTYQLNTYYWLYKYDNYYLTTTFTSTNNIRVPSEKTKYICLNGKTFTSNSSHRVSFSGNVNNYNGGGGFGSNGSVYICDCGGGGGIINTYGSRGMVFRVDTGSLYLYGGTFRAATAAAVINGSLLVDGAALYATDTAINDFGSYTTIIKSGIVSSSGAQAVYADKSSDYNGFFYVRGGTIENTGEGCAIRVGDEKTVHLSGSPIITGKSCDILLEKNATVTVDGSLTGVFSVGLSNPALVTPDKPWTIAVGVPKNGGWADDPFRLGEGNPTGHFVLPDGEAYKDLYLKDGKDADGKPIVQVCRYDHKHTGGTATCTEWGKCTGCGTAYLKPLGHDIVNHNGKDPTCTATGCWAYETCSRCDYTTYQKIPANGHKYGSLVAEKPATCTAEGMRAHYQCADCKKYFDAGKQETTPDKLKIPLAAHQYGDFKVDKPATCTENGSKSKYCTVCKKQTEVTAIPATGHTGGTATTENNVAATCTTDGSYDEVVRCTVCKAVIKREKKIITATGHTGGTATCQKKAVCTACGQEYGGYAPHDFDSTAWGYQEADGHAHLCKTNGCTEHGTIEAHVYSDENDTTCNTCGYTRTITPSHTHRLTLVSAIPATCVSAGNIAYYRCAECDALFADSNGTQSVTEGDVKRAPLGHVPSVDWSCDASGHWHKCQNNCGEKLDLAAHDSSGTATETNSEVCTVCGYVIQAAAGHTHSFCCQVESETYLKAAATCTNGAIYYKSCACGAKGSETFETGSALGHIGGTATCTEKPVCTRCHQAYGDPLGHAPSSDWSHDASGHWHECKKCRQPFDFAAHDYVDKDDETCNTCGYPRVLTPSHTHSLTLVSAVPATCASAGNIEHYRCTVCGKLFGDSSGTRELTAADVTIAKLPHTPETIPAVPATCEQSGMTEGSKCSVCQEVITAQMTIPALNHDWQAATCETPKTCTRCHVTQGKALGHEWGRYIVTVAATQESEGVETRTCQRNDAHKQTRPIPKLPASTYGVSGEVRENGGDPAVGVTVTLVLGDREIASKTTDSEGKYSFGNVAPGVYNLVVKKADIIMTVKVEVISKDVAVSTIIMPQGKTNSVVEVKSDKPEENVEAVVGNLETVFKTTGDDKPFTDEDQYVVDGGGSVEIKLTVTKTDTGATSNEIKDQLSDKTNVGLRLELDVHKTVTPRNAAPTVTRIENTDVLLETIIRLPAALQGKDSYTVYRLHGTDVHALTALKNANGEFIEVSLDKTAITIHAKLYSEYVIAYQERSETGGNGGNTGGTGGNTGNDNGGGHDDRDDGYTPPIVPAQPETHTGYRACRRDDACPIWPFADAAPTAWYHDGVHYCLENGLMRGASGGKFLPDGSTTRAQLVTILWRLEGSPNSAGAAGFGDVADSAWYAGAIRWAAGSGVVKGYDNGCFGPNDAVTREQMAAILYRYAQHKGYDVSAGEDTNILSFNDAFAVSEYAIPAMQWACGSGMVHGIARDGGMLLAPRDTTTRAQAATLIMRFQSAFAKEP